MKQRRKRILLADCHEDVLITLEKLLEDAGFETTTAWTAKEALKLVDSTAFDLAIVNEYLPDAECEELLKAIQKTGRRTLCVVMQPSEPVFMDFVRFGASGAKDIVCKRSFWQILQLAKECLVCDREKQVSVA
jgi:DNA-binding response OmpR family regulator